MSDTDSFIDEVTEEVKRDRLFALMRKWAWVAILAVLLIVGGTAWREYRIASAEASAQDFGDAILSALEGSESADRVAALQDVAVPGPDANAVLQMLIASEESGAGDAEAAVTRLRAVADQTELPAVYRQIAQFKALVQGAQFLSVDERRAGFESLSVPGQPLRLLAEEQLALIEIETGETSAALDRLERLNADSEASQGLRRRASQLIVALGGELPEG